MNFIKFVFILIVLLAPLRAPAQVKGDEATDTTAARELPGKTERELYTPEQDSIFIKALRLRLPALSRLQVELAASEPLWKVSSDDKTNIWSQAFNTMSSIDRSWYIPTGVQQMQHLTNIYNAFYIPGVRTNLGLTGFTIPFEAITGLLGLVEDVSPELKYRLEYPAQVEVVVYSLQATVIATLMNAPQTEGSYTITWNGRDNNGKKMMSGDYIGEVRIGKDRIVRKRIVIN